MKKFTIKFKKTKNAKAVMTWERFATSAAEAKTSAEKALDEEYFGKAVLLSVEEVGA